MNTCSANGCDRKKQCKDYCSMHYHRFTTHGDANYKYKPSFDVLMDKFSNDKEMKNKCWEWHGRLTRSGYGHVFYAGSTKTAHRISYVYFKGEIPNKMNVCHSCDNKKCFNPNHLWLGTTKQNIQDAHNKGLVGTLKGSKNPMSKLKEHQIIEIRNLISKGFKNTEIAKIYNVIHQTISLIRNNKIWKHVKGDINVNQV